MESQNEDNLGSSIAELAHQCRQSLQACTQNQALMQHEWAENRLAEFKLWAAGTGVFASEKTSLDARLAVNRETKNLITSILILLIGCIDKCKTSGPQNAAFEETHRRDSQDMSTSIGNQAVSDPIPRSFSPWSELSSTDSESEEGSTLPVANTSTLQSAKGEVEQIIDYLSRLAVAVRKSGTKSRYQKADQLFKKEDYQDLFQHLIVVVLSRGSQEGRQQYDIDPMSLSPIQERLVISNLRRRNRFQYAQRHSQKLALDALNHGNLSENPASLNSEHDKGRPAQLDEMPITPRPHSTGPRRPTAMTATSASAVGTMIEAVPQQTPTPSQIAKTNITSISAKVDYPRPPRLQEGRRYFQCPCCCQTLPSMFRQEKQWKKHLTGDICPYTCFIENCICPERLYVNRKDWLRHIEKDHPRCWECLPCRRRDQIPLVFASIEEFLRHTKGYHGDSITEDQHPTLIRAAARPAPFGISQCPLCDQTGPADSDELLDHIAEHVHAFSLRSLPWPGDELDAHGNKRNFFNDHDYFEDGSGCRSYNVLSDSTKDTDGLASLPSNASYTNPSDPSRNEGNISVPGDVHETHQNVENAFNRNNLHGDGIEFAKETPKDSKRRTVQVEYIAPQLNSYRGLSDSMKDIDGPASLPSNASLPQRSFFTEIDETSVELTKAPKPGTGAIKSNSPPLPRSPAETLPAIKPPTPPNNLRIPMGPLQTLFRADAPASPRVCR